MYTFKFHFISTLSSDLYSKIFTIYFEQRNQKFTEILIFCNNLHFYSFLIHPLFIFFIFKKAFRLFSSGFMCWRFVWSRLSAVSPSFWWSSYRSSCCGVLFRIILAILLVVIRLKCWWYSLLLFIIHLITSSVWNSSLMIMFLCRSFIVFPFIILRVYILVVVRILFWCFSSYVLKCLFFPIGYLRCTDIVVIRHLSFKCHDLVDSAVLYCSAEVPLIWPCIWYCLLKPAGFYDCLMKVYKILWRSSSSVFFLFFYY